MTVASSFGLVNTLESGCYQKKTSLFGTNALVSKRILHLTTDQKVGGSSPSKRTYSEPVSALRVLRPGWDVALQQGTIVDLPAPSHRFDFGKNSLNEALTTVLRWVE